MKLKKLQQTCPACPSQWEGETKDGYPIYIRYRWGYLSIRKGKKKGDIMSAVRGEEIYGRQLGDNLNGFIEEEKILKIIKEL